MKRISIMAGSWLLAATAVSAQDDPASIKAQAEAQQAQLATAKATLDLENSLRGATPNNPSSISNGEKTAEAQILKYLAYRAAAAQVITNIGADTWTEPRPAPLVVIGSAPPTLALLNAYRSDATTVSSQLKSASDQWTIAERLIKAAAKSKPHATTAAGPAMVSYSFAPAIIPALGLLANGMSMLAPSSTVTGAPLTGDSALVATAFEEAIQAKKGREDFTEFTIGAGGNAAADQLLGEAPEPSGAVTSDDRRILGELHHRHPAAKAAYESYLKQAGDKSGNDSVDAFVKTAGANLATALASYDAFHAKLLSDSGTGIPTAIAIKRQRRLDEGTTSPPLLYILGNEASLTVETKKGVSHWFDAHPFGLSAVVTMNYVYIPAHDVSASPTGERHLVSCVVRAGVYQNIHAAAASNRPVPTCDTDIAPRR